MKREVVLGEQVFWFDENKHPHPAVVTTLLVDSKTGKCEGRVTLTIFNRYSTEHNVVAEQGYDVEDWAFYMAPPTAID